MNKITISTGHPDAGRVYAEAYGEALAREAALREQLETLRSDRDAEKEMKAKARSQRDVQTIRAGDLQTRLQAVQKYVEKLIDQSKNQDSIATGCLSDILYVIKEK